MNEIHMAYGKFREGVVTDELEEVESILSPPWQQNRPARTVVLSEEDPAAVISGLISVPPDQRYFYVEDLPPSLRTSDLARQATTELELDAVAADIINTQDLTGEAMNPGLVSLWTDERRRREAAGLSDPVTPPSSPPRDHPAGEKSESEKFWYERLCQAIQEKKLSTEPRDYQDPEDPDATINLERRLRPQVYPEETSQGDLQSLPDATLLEPHILSLSETLNTTADLSVSESQHPYSDDTIVDEQFILSQLHESNNVSQNESVDEELLDLLDDLAQDADKNEEEQEEEGVGEKEKEEDMFKTPTSARSQRSQRSRSRSQGSSARKGSKSVSQVLDLEEKEEEEEDLETLEMSQAIWSSDTNWADQDQSFMEDLARTLNCQTDQTTCDIEDLVK